MSDGVPLWTTQDQLERLRSRLEAAGFISVTFTENESGALVICASRNRRTRSVTIETPQEMSGVVDQFRNWLRSRDAEASDFNG